MSKYNGPKPEDILVQDLIALMQQGKTPWRKDWSEVSSVHRNFLTGHQYTGSNIILLELGMAMRGAALPFWCGAAEVKKHGIFPKKGSKSVRILRPQVNKKEEEIEGQLKEKVWTSFKVVPVFNVIDLQGDKLSELIEKAKADFGLNVSTITDDVRLHEAEAILDQWNVDIVHGGSRACYIPSIDQINLPYFKSFKSVEAYYATRAHECIHSTGHYDRLKRNLSGQFGSQSYAIEELVAELGAVLLCNKLKISSDFSNHAAYLSHWIEILNEDPKVLFKSLSAARKAVDLILNPDSKNNITNEFVPGELAMAS